MSDNYYSIKSSSGELLLAYYNVNTFDAEKVAKVKHYLAENIIYALLIMASDFKVSFTSYKAEYCEHLAESMVLFQPEVLQEVHEFLPTDSETKRHIQNLREAVTALFTSGLHMHLQADSPEWQTIRSATMKLLDRLGISYQHPEHYEEQHLEMDWL